ncbi:MAG: hypothetical protein IPK07_16890 [Deltaproteobacteria bacterium]|nr:hypothetical protein [Deltaproteobacteria bacterium]
MSKPPRTSDDPLRGYPPEVREEDRRVVRLTRYLDLALAMIRRGQLSLQDASALVSQARQVAEGYFPGSGSTFDLIHAPRFRRAIAEAYTSVN